MRVSSVVRQGVFATTRFSFTLAMVWSLAGWTTACNDSATDSADSEVGESDPPDAQSSVEPESTNVPLPVPGEPTAPEPSGPAPDTDTEGGTGPAVGTDTELSTDIEPVAEAGTESDVASTGGADAGLDAGAGDSGVVEAGPGPCPAVPEFVEPTLLSETGLYADVATEQLADGVFEYAPEYELWTDGAVKRRFVRLPPCTQIDTSDMDFWTYPLGTKLWKQFSRENADGELVRVETRLIQKYTQTKWFMTAFIWNDEQTDALVDPADDAATLVLSENAKGTEHDVPGRAACETCHGGMWDRVLGFTALQLSHPAQPGFMTLDELVARELVSVPPPAPIDLPGTPEQADALGYLHANCGHCHNPNSKQANLGMELWQKSGQLGSVEETTAYLTNVGLDTQSSQKPLDEPPVRVVPGDPEQSAVYWRMVQPPVFPGMPEGGVHMPLIGTEITDDLGVQLVEDWILSLQ